MNKKNFFLLIGENKRSTLYLYVLSSFLAIFFEMLGLGSVPILALIITEPELVTSKFYEFTNVNIYLNRNELVIYSCIIFFLIFLLKNLILAFIAYFQAKILKIYRQSVTSLVFKKFINSNYQFFLNNNPSLLIRKINADIRNAFTYFLAILQLYREVILVLVILLFLISIEPLIYTLTFALFILITIIFRLIYKKMLSNKGSILLEEGSNKLKILNQSFYSIKEIKIMNKESFFISKFFHNTKILENISFINAFITSLPRLVFEILTILVIVFFTSILIILNKPQEFIIPIISLLVAAGARFIPSFNIINSSFAALRLFKKSYESIVETIDKSQIEDLNIIEETDNKKKILFSNQIEIKNINFSYTNKKILNDINIKINKGETIGIIGVSGAGKTTLVNIFLGLLKSSAGSILVDGKNIYENIRNWRAKIGYVPQDVHLIDDTITSNICFGQKDENFDKDLFQKVINDSQLSEFINQLQDKEMTIVGNAGIRISGGQRQRIAIARALYINPEIMILDEATSSLDLENEKKIIDEVNINKDNKTIIVISHRKNALAHCDKIFLIENGAISKLLSYNDLKNIDYNI